MLMRLQRAVQRLASRSVTASRPVGGTRLRECPELVFYPSKGPLSPQLVLSSSTIRRGCSGGRPYAWVMALVITIPDDAARRLAEAAAGRGVTPEELALDLVIEHLPPAGQNGPARDALLAFVGSASGRGTRFDIHDARRDLAARRQAEGIANL